MTTTGAAKENKLSGDYTQYIQMYVNNKIYRYLTMSTCVNIMRYLLMIFIVISCLAALVVLGLDLDLLLNGPDYLSKVITNVVNR